MPDERVTVGHLAKLFVGLVLLAARAAVVVIGIAIVISLLGDNSEPNNLPDAVWDGALFLGLAILTHGIMQKF